MTGTTGCSADSLHNTALSMLGTTLDVRRFDTLVHAGPMDFRGLVHEIPNADLDWSNTIFYTVTDPQLTERLKGRFGQRPLWPDSVIRSACNAAVHLPARLYSAPAPIREFLATHCEFKNEHADGGFSDHLDFCAEYTARYFPRGSANVLFLHSICGVNTNLFPLDFDKIPALAPLLTQHEFLHVQAFPGMLRLLFLELLDVLWDTPAQQPCGVTIHTFHHTTLTLEGDDFWCHLNYHLVHMLDFLPTQNFDQFAVQDGFTRLFLRLHEYLRKRDKLWADVRLERLGKVPGMAADGEELPTWEYLHSKVNPEDAARAHAQLGAQMRKYSAAIDHDLSYQIHWK